MSTFAGSINHRFYPGGQTVQEVFTSVFNFLTSSYAQSLGIQLVAWNKGSGGTGVGYWDETPHFGTNAWGCFFFASASNPFAFLLQYSDNGTTFGASPGNPATAAAGNTGGGQLAWAAAAIVDGTNPWAGTTASNGSDTKGNPVWNVGSDNTVYCIPRSNSPGGTHFGVGRYNMCACINGSAQNADWTGWNNRGLFMHVVADKNNIAMVHDPAYFGEHFMNWCGIYSGSANNSSPVKLGGLNNWVPYLTTYVPYVYGAYTFGSPTGNGGSNGGLGSLGDGGVSIKSVPTSGTVAYSIDALPSSGMAMAYPHRVGSSSLGGTNAGWYVISNVMFLVAETPYYGYVGDITFWGMGFMLPSRTTSQDKLLANLGWGRGGDGGIYQNAGAYVIPWDGYSVPGSATGNPQLTRRGVQWVR